MTGKGKGEILYLNWRWGTKAWVMNRIRYPNSPSRQLWMPWVKNSSSNFKENQLINESASIPPQE